MKKVWIIAANIYRRQIRSSTFLLLTFILPVLMVIAGAVPILRETAGELPTVGIVDSSGKLAQVQEVGSGDDTLFVISYAEEEAARRAVQEGEIVGFLTVPSSYPEEGQLIYYGESEPRTKLYEALKVYVQQALAADAPVWKAQRLRAPGYVTYVDLETGEEIVQGPALVVRVVAPAFLAVTFALMIYTTISQMGAVMVEEKEERSLEMILTSLRPWELVGGKVLGMGLVSLTQIAIWSLAAVVAAGLALSGSLNLDELVLPWRALLWAALLGVPTYFLYVVLAAGLGLMAGGRAQARQLAGILGFVAMAPMWLMGLLVQDPDGPLAVTLTLFPLTSPIFALIRMVITSVPLWQLVASVALILTGLAFSIYIVARTFRVTLLLYGQTLHPRQIWQAMKASRV